jgi:hypothetical protein
LSALSYAALLAVPKKPLRDLSFPASLTIPTAVFSRASNKRRDSMITLKSLGRKLEKLEASMQKDARRLSKLIRKVKRAATSETMPRPNKATTPVSSAKQKRELSPEARAKLSALMHERWAAKRAGARAVPVAIVEEATPVSTTDGNAAAGA